MRTPVLSKKFRKDYELCIKQNKKISGLKNIMSALQNGEVLPPQYSDHKLHGEYKNCRGCHIEPDWVWVYRIEEQENKIHFVRTGSHSDLYE